MRCTINSLRIRTIFNSHSTLRLHPPQRRPGSYLAGDIGPCSHDTCWLTSGRRRPSSRLLLSFDGGDAGDTGTVPPDASAREEGSLGSNKTPAVSAPRGDPATAPRKRGRPRGSKSKNTEGQRTPGVLESAAGSAPAVKPKRGRPKGSKSRKSMDMLKEESPPPRPSAASTSSAATDAKIAATRSNIADGSVNARPPRRISIARAATAANKKAAATEKEAVAKARAEAAAAVAAAVSAAAAARAEAESPAGAVSNSVIFTGRAFSDGKSKMAMDDDDLVAAAVAAMKKGSGNRGGRKRGRPPVAKPGAIRLSQERAGSRDDPLLDSQQPQEGENADNSDSLLGRAEVDAILSLGSNGGGGGLGVDGRDSGSDGMGASAVAVERQAGSEVEGTEEMEKTEEAAALRALMSDVGFREDEVAAYSLEELVSLREVCVSDFDCV